MTEAKAFVLDSNWPAISRQINALADVPVDLPFPIQSPFAIRSDLHKLSPADPGIIRLDVDYPRYAREKLRLLRDSACTFLRADTARDLLPVWLAIVKALAEQVPGFARVEGLPANNSIAASDELAACSVQFYGSGLFWRWQSGRGQLTGTRSDSVQLAAWLESHCAATSGADLLACTLALSLQEDFVLMQANPAGLAQAQSLFVSFPSGWRPEEKLGADLSQIHQPVADGQALRRASPGLSQAMLNKGPFVRYVWTLSDSDALDRHPDRVSAVAAADKSADPLAGIWYRCERQTLLPLPGQSAAAFFIRVYVAPLRSAANSPLRRQLLVDSLRSMTPAVIDYKNLKGLRERVFSAWG